MIDGLSLQNPGALGIALNSALSVQSSIDTLTAQSSSGLISPDYAGLGDAAGLSLDLSGQLALNAAAQGNAAQASDINQVAQTALGQIQTLVSGLASQLLGQAASSAAGLSTLSVSAGNALSQVAELLNTKLGQVYVFAGQDNRTPPVPQAGTIAQSAFVAAIAGAVANLPVSGAAAVQAQLLSAATAAASTPFSPTLEANPLPATADLGGGQTTQLALLANKNRDAVSANVGVTSTGSYTRDILMGLATLSTLGTANATDPQTQALLANVQATLSGADTALNTDIGGLGVRQDQVASAQTELGATATALHANLSSLQDADEATVATKLAAAQTQLQASFKIISDVAQLSLAKYL